MKACTSDEVSPEYDQGRRRGPQGPRFFGFATTFVLTTRRPNPTKEAAEGLSDLASRPPHNKLHSFYQLSPAHIRSRSGSFTSAFIGFGRNLVSIVPSDGNPTVEVLVAPGGPRFIPGSSMIFPVLHRMCRHDGTARDDLLDDPCWRPIRRDFCLPLEAGPHNVRLESRPTAEVIQKHLLFVSASASLPWPTLARRGPILARSSSQLANFG